MDWSTVPYFSVLILVPLIISPATCGISYQSVSFVHHTPIVKTIRRPINVIGRPLRYNTPVHVPVNFYEALSHPDEIWPNNLFEGAESIFDVTLTGESHPEHSAHEYFNDLELAPDPYLLTGYRAKQVADFIYGRGELFYNDIPHAKALIKLQTKRAENGLRPNRLGSINPGSPFYREKRHYTF